MPLRIILDILDIWNRKYEADTKNSLLCDLPAVRTFFSYSFS